MERLQISDRFSNFSESIPLFTLCVITLKEKNPKQEYLQAIFKFQPLWHKQQCKILKIQSNFLAELFHDGVPYHIETSPLIYRAKQWTGF